MKLIGDLFDKVYEPQGYTHTRRTVRAILLNDKNEIGLLFIHGEDGFGLRNHYETPGGGIELHETHIQTLNRELQEEVGVKVEIIDELGLIINRFNYLKRITSSYYYICRVIGTTETSLTKGEKELFKGVVWKSLEYWLDKLKTGDNPVDRLVHEREYLALVKYHEWLNN